MCAVLEQMKLISGGKKRTRGCLGLGGDWLKGAHGEIFADGNVLNLNKSVGYKDECICQNIIKPYTLRCVLFSVCKWIPQEKRKSACAASHNPVSVPAAEWRQRLSSEEQGLRRRWQRAVRRALGAGGP